MLFTKSKTKIVLGLGFGDEGKGRTVDYLFSLESKYDSICVRFSGGHQVGHTVMIKDRKYDKHVHSNYGSGTLRGVPTYYSEYCTFYPNTMYEEERLLIKNTDVLPTLYFHPHVMLTTPYDVAYNRALEICRGRHRHGSVGLGFGATIERNTESGYKLYAIDTQNPTIYRLKVEAIKKYYSEKIEKFDFGFQDTYQKELSFIEDRFFELINFLPFTIKPYWYLNHYPNIVFEGSQGILLDKDHGVFPNVTYSNTTSKNAFEILKKLDTEPPDIYYVTRCYQTRHGNGWLNDSEEIKLINNEHETCGENPHQGKLRTAELDYVLLNHALRIDDVYSNSIFNWWDGSDRKPWGSKTIVVTCMDQRPDFVFDKSKISFLYKTLFFDSPYN
jgi:adenylosuccinate synthase